MLVDPQVEALKARLAQLRSSIHRTQYTGLRDHCVQSTMPGCDRIRNSMSEQAAPGRLHYGASRPIVAVYQVEQEWEASLQEHVKYSRQAQVLKTVPGSASINRCRFRRGSKRWKQRSAYPDPSLMW